MTRLRTFATTRQLATHFSSHITELATHLDQQPTRVAIHAPKCVATLGLGARKCVATQKEGSESVWPLKQGPGKCVANGWAGVRAGDSGVGHAHGDSTPSYRTPPI